MFAFFKKRAKKIFSIRHFLWGITSFQPKNRYNWPGLSGEVERFCEKCQICAKSGEALQNTKNRVIKTSRPNELWEIDLIGRIPGERNTNQFIFVAIDHYTKWVETKAINYKTAEEIVKAIEELIIRKHGTPEKILTDQGLEFDNQKVKEITRIYGIEWLFASPRHHETVGAVERVNQTLMIIIKKITDFGRLSWRTNLAKAVWAYNISLHRAINTSPYILKYGKIPELEIDHTLGQPEITVGKTEIQNKRDRHFEGYSKDVEKGTKVVKYNLQPGDPVLIFIAPLKDKLKEKWIGGFKIKEKNSQTRI